METNRPKEANVSLSQSEISNFLAQSERDFAATLRAVPNMRTGQTYVTGAGPLLTVNAISYGHVAVEAVIAGTAPALEATLTEDGRTANFKQWHEGPEGPSVYYERWTKEGRMSHGYVDAYSRKLVQAG